MHAVGERRVEVGIQSAGGGIGITFDTGNLYQSAYGVAGHAQMMFQSHFRCIFNLGGAASEQLVGGGRSHGASYTDFCLASGFCTGNRSILLDDISYQSGCGEGAENTCVTEVAAFANDKARPAPLRMIRKWER